MLIKGVKFARKKKLDLKFFVALLEGFFLELVLLSATIKRCVVSRMRDFNPSFARPIALKCHFLLVLDFNTLKMFVTQIKFDFTYLHTYLPPYLTTYLPTYLPKESQTLKL